MEGIAWRAGMEGRSVLGACGGGPWGQGRTLLHTPTRVSDGLCDGKRHATEDHAPCIHGVHAVRGAW
jgi:hypothetical protein